MLIELHFPILGTEICADHSYALYGAMSRIVPKIHTDEMPLRIGPIRGSYIGDGKLRLDGAILRVRLRPDDLPALLPLAGKALDLDGHNIRLGVPQVRGLTPATNLIARMVVIKASSPKTDPADKLSRDREQTKRYQSPVDFLAAVRRELTRQAIHADANLPLHETGPRQGQPRRHVVRIKGKAIVGFTVLVQGLTAEESLQLQEQGVGGRGKLGCGFFVPMKEDSQ
jgi:hypothetical protein